MVRGKKMNPTKSLIVANWKMNPETEKEAASLAESIERGIKGLRDIEVVICPPFIYLSNVKGQLLTAYLGAQDCFWENEGAYTGEISASMLERFGCSYVILGHSERKNYLQESPDVINKKLRTVLQTGLTPIVCIGEKDKDGVDSRKAVERQMRDILKNIDKAQIPRVVLTYEPEWAISTSKHAKPSTPLDAKKTIQFMKTVLTDIFGEFEASEVKILYGGSVDSRNIADFITYGETDGALVGGVSLRAGEFVALVKNATA